MNAFHFKHFFNAGLVFEILLLPSLTQETNVNSSLNNVFGKVIYFGPQRAHIVDCKGWEIHCFNKSIILFDISVETRSSFNKYMRRCSGGNERDCTHAQSVWI